MAIRQMWSFDHLPAGLDLTAANAIQQYTDIEPTSIPFSFNATSGTYITADGWMSMANHKFGSTSYTTSLNAIATPMSTLFPAGSNLAYVGFRTRVPTGSSLPANSTSAWLAWLSVQSSGATQIPLVSEANMVTWGYNVPGAEYYIEVMFNRSAQTYSVWVNGTLRVNAASLALNTYVYFWTGMAGFANGAVSSAPVARDYRDFYFLEDTGDGLASSARLGGPRAVLQPLQLLSAPDFNLVPGASGVTKLIDALTFPYPNPPIATPNVVANTLGDVLTGSFGASVPNGSKIIVVQHIGALQASDTNTPMGFALTQGSNTQPLASRVEKDTTMRHGAVLGIQTLAPDGGAWTMAKLAATQLVATQLSPPVTSAFLSHFDAADAGVLTSPAQRSTPAKFGATALAVPNVTNAKIVYPDSSAIHLSGDFTVECFFYRSALTANGSMLIDKSVSSSQRAYIYFLQQQLRVLGDDQAVLLIGSSAGLPVASSTYAHFALVKKDTTWTAYINGVSIGSATSSATFGVNSGAMVVGNTFDNGACPFSGFIDEMRISTSAMYTANFTPPTVAFTN